MLFEIVVGAANDHIGQQQQANEVRDGHHAVQGVGDIPHQGAVSGGTYDAHQNKDHLKDPHHRFIVVGQIGPAPLTVVAPAQDGGQGKEKQADLNDGPADGPGQDGIEGRATAAAPLVA